MSFKSDTKYIFTEQKWDYADWMIWGGIVVMLLWIVAKLSRII